MSDSSYSSLRMEGIRKPALGVSLSRIVGSAALAIVLVLGLLHVHHLIVQGLRSPHFRLLLDQPSLVASTFESADPVRILGILNFCGFLIACVLAGSACAWYSSKMAYRAIRLGVAGAREMIRPFKPARVPNDFESESIVRKMLRDGVLKYEPLDDFISALFGQGSMFVTPTARPLMKENAVRLKARLKVAATLTALAVSIYFALSLLPGSDWLSGLGAPTRQWVPRILEVSKWNLLMLPLAGLIASHLAIAGVEYVSMALLVPKEEPSTQALARNQHYDGFGHPQHLVQRLPEIAESLAWKGFPNRVSSSGFSERGSTVVSDSGSFESTIFIEQQPQPISDRVATAGTVLMLSGWSLVIGSAAVLFMLLLPFPVVRYLDRLTMSEQFLLAPVYVLIAAFLVSSLSRNGARHIAQAEEILASRRFLSEAVLMNVEGTLGRSSLTVGKATDESIESSNLVVRSEFTVRFWAGRILSECTRLDEDRVPLSVRESTHSATWIELLSRNIDTLRSAGVRPIGVDIGSPELRTIVEANMQNALFKKNADQPVAQASADAILPRRRADAIAPPADSDVDYIDCPDCAEPVRAKARICRHCGLTLRPTAVENGDRTL